MADGTRNVMLKVEENLCRACKKCLAGEACRGNAFLRFDRDESPFLDMSRCWGCLECVPACPFGAVVRHVYSNE